MNLQTITQQELDSLYEKWKDIVDNQTRRIYSWTTGKELAFLCEYAQQNSHIIEIGSYVGRSAKCMLLSNPELTITSLDTWDDEGSYDELKFNLRDERNTDHTNRHLSIKGASHGSLTALSSDTLQRIVDTKKYLEDHQGDILKSKLIPYSGAFIDGGHLYDDVKGDIAGIRKLLPAGALICGHDYRINLPEDGVTKAVREAFPNHHVLPGESIWIATL